MKIKKDFLTKNKYSRPGTKLNKVKGVVIHWYGNPKSTAQANRNYWESLKSGASGVYASAHYCISPDGSVVQAIPEDEMAYQVGAPNYTKDALNKLSSYPNNCVIGIENAHPDWDGKFYDADYQTCVQLAADILKRHGLNETNLWRHSDIVGASYKDCPRYYTKHPEAWKKLKADVKKALSGASPASKTEFFAFAPKAIVITKPDGAGAYSDKELKKKVKHYKKGTKLTIKSCVKDKNGVVRFLTIHGTYITANMAYVRVWNEPSKYKDFKKESGTFIPSQTVEVKLEASAKASKKSTRKKGDKVKYDGYVNRDGFIWIGIHTKYGTRYYVKARNSKTGKALGTFK